jgi:hypothetical protein
MKLDEQYSILNDENNFKLIEHKIKGEKAKNIGEGREVVQGYYGTLEAALTGYIKHSTRSDLPEDIQALSDKLDSIKTNIERFCKSIAVYKGRDIDLNSIESEDTTEAASVIEDD